MVVIGDAIDRDPAPGRFAAVKDEGLHEAGLHRQRCDDRKDICPHKLHKATSCSHHRENFIGGFHKTFRESLAILVITIEQSIRS